MKLIVRKKTLYLTIPFIIFLLVPCINSTVFALPYRLSLEILLVTGIIMIFFALISKKKLNFSITYYDAFLLLLLFLILFRNGDLENGEPTYELIAIITIFLAIIDKKNINEYSTIVENFWYWFGLTNLLFTIFFYVNPNMYISTIYPMAGKQYQENLLYCYQQGYQTGITLHYSTNGMYLALFSGAAFVKFLSSKKRHILYFLVFILGIWGILLTAKRAHFAFSLIAVFIVYYLYSNKHTRFLKTIGIVIMTIVIWSIAANYVPQIAEIAKRFDSAFSGQDNPMEERMFLRLYAIRLFRNSPIIGHGWNSYKYLAEKNLGVYIAGHNVYLQLLAETGVIGFAVFLIYFIYIGYLATGHVPIIERSNYKDILKISQFLLFFFVYFILYCFTGNPLYENFHLPIIIMLPECIYLFLKSIK